MAVMAMRKRWVVPTPTEGDDEQLLMALRPQRLDEYVGQRAVVERLRIALDAAKQRGEPLEHTLLYGPPGLGKRQAFWDLGYGCWWVGVGGGGRARGNGQTNLCLSGVGGRQ